MQTDTPVTTPAPSGVPMEVVLVVVAADDFPVAAHSAPLSAIPSAKDVVAVLVAGVTDPTGPLSPEPPVCTVVMIFLPKMPI